MDAPYRVPAILHESSATCSPPTGNTLFAWDLPSVTASPALKMNTLDRGFAVDHIFPFVHELVPILTQPTLRALI